MQIDIIYPHQNIIIQYYTSASIPSASWCTKNNNNAFGKINGLEIQLMPVD